jgi:beta-fructofuranosidase
MDYDTLTFTPEGDYQYLDFGFDFYAAQFAANVDDPDMAILIGWIGLPDNHYPTEEEDWEGSMSLPREVRLVDGHLVQSPVKEFDSLKGEEVPAEGKLPVICDVAIDVPEGDFDLKLFTKADGSGGFSLHYDAAKKALTVDKTGMDKRYNQNVGEVLVVPLGRELKDIRAIIDSCSVEFFINGGETTFTSHVYPTADEHNYTVTEGAGVKITTLKPSVKDDFIV